MAFNYFLAIEKVAFNCNLQFLINLSFKGIVICLFWFFLMYNQMLTILVCISDCFVVKVGVIFGVVV